MSDFVDQLRKALRHSVEHDDYESSSKPKFIGAKFFQEWFRMEGRSYNFIFKKNLGITNIHLSELICLIKDNVSDSQASQFSDDLLFQGTRQFADFVDEAMGQVIGEKDEVRWERDLTAFCKAYANVFQRTVLVNIYYGSCTVFCPPNITLDLENMCKVSGYIHSCGDLIYIRNVNKALFKHLAGQIANHIRKNNIQEKIFFVPYTYEDFDTSLLSEHKKEDIRDGVEDLKLRIEKVNMGGEDLVSVLNKLSVELKHELEIPPPGNYKTHHVGERKDSIWLYQDFSISPSINKIARSDKRYYVCYHQKYQNGNYFHIFDENKPAWIAHTTIPHTLYAAMLNITKPWAPGSLEFCDPFCGTGTALLESSKYSELRISGYDINPAFKKLVEDNRYIFDLDATELKNRISELKEILESVTTDYEIDVTNSHPYAVARKKVEQLEGTDRKDSFEAIDEETAEWLEKIDFITRFCFYVCLRVALRHKRKTKRIHDATEKLKALNEAFNKEYSTLLAELEDLFAAKTRKQFNGEYLGMYSKVLVLNNLNYDWKEVRTRDVISLEENNYDLIVTDPPYGYNTNELFNDSIALYQRIVSKLVKAVRDDGQIVLCLPDMSNTGKSIPFFARKSYLMSVLLLTIRENCCEAYVVANQLPYPAEIFRPPYYWNSGALSRNIIHLRIRKERKTTENV